MEIREKKHERSTRSGRAQLMEIPMRGIALHLYLLRLLPYGKSIHIYEA
jgi:hypothetical protein